VWSNSFNYIWANEKGLIHIWAKLKTFTSVRNIWTKSISQIKFGSLLELHSTVGNFKQSHSKLGYIEKLH